MSDRDIKGNVQVLRELASKTLADGISDDDRKVAAALMDAGLSLIERFLLDVNRIADGVEGIYFQLAGKSDPTRS